jgi:hypothetical protein
VFPAHEGEQPADQLVLVHPAALDLAHDLGELALAVQQLGPRRVKHLVTQPVYPCNAAIGQKVGPREVIGSVANG